MARALHEPALGDLDRLGGAGGPRTPRPVDRAAVGVGRRCRPVGCSRRCSRRASSDSPGPGSSRRGRSCPSRRREAPLHVVAEVRRDPPCRRPGREGQGPFVGQVQARSRAKEARVGSMASGGFPRASRSTFVSRISSSPYGSAGAAPAGPGRTRTEARMAMAATARGKGATRPRRAPRSKNGRGVTGGRRPSAPCCRAATPAPIARAFGAARTKGLCGGAPP